MGTPSIDQLQRAIEIKQQIAKLEAELQSILGRGANGVSAPASTPTAKPGRKKGKMSAAGRAAIRLAQQTRWAKIKAAKSGQASKAPATGKGRRKMSAEARAKIAAAQRARWAKAKGRKS